MGNVLFSNYKIKMKDTEYLSLSFSLKVILIIVSCFRFNGRWGLVGRVDEKMGDHPLGIAKCWNAVDWRLVDEMDTKEQIDRNICQLLRYASRGKWSVRIDVKSSPSVSTDSTHVERAVLKSQRTFNLQRPGYSSSPFRVI
jgi:hypothetical protein